jgi:hypothetical protein
MASVDKTFEALLDDPEERVECTKVLDVADRPHFLPKSAEASARPYARSALAPAPRRSSSWAQPRPKTANRFAASRPTSG